jgi:2-methylisocitrate lyase-like PEP mutase family enzyme
MPSYGDALRANLLERPIVPFIGVYDVFSASLAGRRFEGLFLSGFSFAASYYGVPDIGFVAWPDMVGFVGRVRAILPHHHLLVDVDDGYGDADLAAHVIRQVESAGASGIILEDQQRPRKCGHLGGKQVVELDAFVAKLERVLAARRGLFVVARTDATDHDERLRRAEAFQAAGADAILVDGIEDLAMLDELSTRISRPIVFNQIAGGRSPRCGLSDLSARGVSLVNYSTPCLFAAQAAIEEAVDQIDTDDGRIPDPDEGHVGGEPPDGVARPLPHTQRD